MKYRTKLIDTDACREPRTRRHCYMCQRDIKPRAKAREVHVIDGGGVVLHPDDESMYTSDGGDIGMQLLGFACARKFGMEWSRPENDWTQTPATAAEPDAECTACGAMFFSGEGPSFDLAVCASCFSKPGMGPKAVVRR